MAWLETTITIITITIPSKQSQNPAVCEYSRIRLTVKTINDMMKLIQLAGVFTAVGCTCAERLGLAVAALAVAFAAVLFEEYERQNKETKNN